MKRLLPILGLILPISGMAVPQSGSPNECMYIADIAITARAMAEAEISKEMGARVMVLVYSEDMMNKWGELILNSAYSDKRTAKEYAGDLFEHCTTSMGDMEKFFGVGA